MKIGDRVYVHGFVDEIRKDIVIIRNEGGYFGTVKSEIVEAQKAEDIVSVIRCKDCKYYEEQDETIGTCLLTESGAHVKGYCAWEERKEE